jgi:hypothetical protein
VGCRAGFRAVRPSSDAETTITPRRDVTAAIA